MTELSHKHSIKSSLIVILAKWISRFFGLISTVIIARILMPEDFGLIGTAMIFIGFVDLLSMFGLENALIRKANATKQDYNTIWTLQILQKLLIGLIIFLLSPAIANAFDDPRLTALLQVMSIAFFVTAFKNIGVVDFRKKLQFNKEFNYTLIDKVLGVVTTIAAVLYYQSYWGIAYAMVIKSFATLALSFIMSPYRPKFSLTGSAEFLGFSLWEFLNNILRYAQSKIDDVFVAKHWGAATLGHYNLSKELSSMVLSEVVFPINRAMVPIYSKHIERNEFKQAQDQCLEMFSTLSVVLFPLCFGMYAIADVAFPLIFGPQWTIASEMFKWLALSFIAECLFRFFNSYFVSAGKVKTFAKYNTVFFIVLIVTLVVVYLNNYDYIALTQAKFISQTLTFACLLYLISKHLEVQYFTFVSLIFRPLLASLAMVYTIVQLDTLNINALWLEFLLIAIVGALSYALTLLALTCVKINRDSQYVHFEHKLYLRLTALISSTLLRLKERF